MQIFLDDEREPVNSLDWVIVKSYNEFVAVVLPLNEGELEYISFDHDLGDDSLSGYDAVKFLVELDQERDGKLLTPTFKWYTHSQNPVGAKSINDYLNWYTDWKFERK